MLLLFISCVETISTIVVIIVDDDVVLFEPRNLLLMFGENRVSNIFVVVIVDSDDDVDVDIFVLLSIGVTRKLSFKVWLTQVSNSFDTFVVDFLVVIVVIVDIVVVDHRNLHLKILNFDNFEKALFRGGYF